jgi:hypothetical protein
MLKIRCGNLKYVVLSVWEMGKMKYVNNIHRKFRAGARAAKSVDR